MGGITDDQTRGIKNGQVNLMYNIVPTNNGDGTVTIALPKRVVWALKVFEKHGVDQSNFKSGFTMQDAVKLAEDLENPS